MKKLSIAVITLVAGLTVLGTAHAKQFNSERSMEKMTEKLSLTETQQAHFQNYLDEKVALLEERKSKRKGGKDEKGEKDKKSEEGSTKNAAFASLLEQEQISVEQIYAAVDENIAKKREKRQNMMNSFVVFYNSLDAEQREKASHFLRKVIKSTMGGRGRKGKKHNKNSERHNHSKSDKDS